MLNALRRNIERTRLVRELYARLTVRARSPEFFRDFGVADTIDGRFDLLTLHAWLTLQRLRAAGQIEVAHALSDAIFIGFDEALRDLGAGDVGMGRKIKQLGEAFNGRIQAYDAARGETALAHAIVRNVYRGNIEHTADAQSLAQYAIAAKARLAACDPLSGMLDFGPLPRLIGKPCH